LHEVTTAIITGDEIAQDLFGKNLLVDIPLPDRTLIAGAIRRANAAIAQLLGGNIGFTARSAWLSYPAENNRSGPLAVATHPTVRDRIQLLHWPVNIASIEVWEDRDKSRLAADYDNDAKLTIESGYSIECESMRVVDGLTLSDRFVTIRRVGSSWPKPPGAAFVRYTAGITQENSPDIWEIIRTATLQTFEAQFYRSKQTASIGSNAGPVASESIGKYSYSVNTSSMAMTQSGVATAAMATLSDVIDYGVYL